MYFDALTLSAIVDEMRDQIVGGRVQEAVLVDALTVGLEVYSPPRRRYVLMSAHPQWAHVLLSGEKARRGVEKASPLLLMLRRFVRDSRLHDLRQVPHERIVEFEFVHHEAGKTTLVGEVMGRHSNVILLDGDNVIMDSVKRVGADVNRYRVIQPREPYVPPPPQEKLLPEDLTELRARALIDGGAARAPLWKTLVAGIRGVSPLLARELVYRAYGDAELLAHPDLRVSPLLQEIARLVLAGSRHPWSPSVAMADDVPIAFAPYELRHLGDWQPAPTISRAAELYLAAERGRDPYAAARERVQAIIGGLRKQLDRKRQSLNRSLVGSEELDRLRLSGEMVLAYAHELKPGQTRLHVDLGPGQPVLDIELHPVETPSSNAQAYFDRYTRAKKAAKEVPALLEELELEDRNFAQLLTDLQLASNAGEIDEVLQSLAEAGHIQETGKRGRAGARAPRSQPLAQRSDDGFTVLIGKNSRQNEEVTFHRAAGDDVWLHARGVPGAHVVIRSEGKAVPEATLRQAAAWAAHFSAGRADRTVAVDYTERKHVRRIKGAAPGLVTYTHESTLHVAPEAPPRVSQP